MEVREQRGRDGKGGGPDGRASGMQEQRLAASQVRMVWGRYGGPGWGGGWRRLAGMADKEEGRVSPDGAQSSSVNAQ